MKKLAQIILGLFILSNVAIASDLTVPKKGYSVDSLSTSTIGMNRLLHGYVLGVDDYSASDGIFAYSNALQFGRQAVDKETSSDERLHFYGSTNGTTTEINLQNYSVSGTVDRSIWGQNVYFRMAAAGSTTAFTNQGGGLVRATSASHGLRANDVVTITDTTNYNGTFAIQATSGTDYFDFIDTYVADDATGSWSRAATLAKNNNYLSGIYSQIDSTNDDTTTNYTMYAIRTAGTSTQTAMWSSVLTASGVNFGVGTDAPTAPLHVIGNTLFTGTSTINGDIMVVGGNFMSNAATVNLFTGTSTAISLGSASATTTINGNLSITGTTTIGTSSLTLLTVSGTTTLNGIVNAGDGGDAITLDSSDWDIGATGIMTGIGSITSDGLILTGDDVQINGGDVLSNAATVNLFVGTATTLNIGNVATTLNLANGFLSLGSSTQAITLAGTTTSAGDLYVNGGDLLTNQTTFSLLNTVVTTANILGNASSISVGSSTGTTTVNHDIILDKAGSSVNSPYLMLKGDNAGAEVRGAIQTMYGADPYLRFSVDDDSATPVLTAVFDVKDTGIFFATDNTVDIGGVADNRPKNLYLAGNLDILGGYLTSGSSTFNLLNTTVSTINFGGAATSLQFSNGFFNLGSSTQLASIVGTTTMTGNLAVGTTTAPYDTIVSSNGTTTIYMESTSASQGTCLVMRPTNSGSALPVAIYIDENLLLGTTTLANCT